MLSFVFVFIEIIKMYTYICNDFLTRFINLKLFRCWGYSIVTYPVSYTDYLCCPGWRDNNGDRNCVMRKQQTSSLLSLSLQKFINNAFLCNCLIYITLSIDVFTKIRKLAVFLKKQTYSFMVCSLDKGTTKSLVVRELLRIVSQPKSRQPPDLSGTLKTAKFKDWVLSFTCNLQA